MSDNNLKLADRKVIALNGMMGVGKTTIGSSLAEKLGIYFVDSDQEIEDHQKKSLSEVFSEDGEEYFRKIEKKIIKDIFDRDEPMVLSLGGGSLVDKDTADLVRKKAISVWLSADMEVMLHRIIGKDNRPLLKDKNKRAKLEFLMEKRLPLYEKSNLKIDTGVENKEMIVTQIIKLLSELTR